jgi:hypothetical protein
LVRRSTGILPISNLANSKQQTANSRQQTADSKQQTAGEPYEIQ